MKHRLCGERAQSGDPSTLRQMFFKMKKLLWFSFLVLALVGCTKQRTGHTNNPEPKTFFRDQHQRHPDRHSENPSPLNPPHDDKEVIVSSRDWLELSGQLLETGELLSGDCICARLICSGPQSHQKVFYEFCLTLIRT